MIKAVATVTSVLLSLGLAGLLPAGPQPPREGPPPKAKKKYDPKKKDEPNVKKAEPKKKGGPGPAADLRRAYDLLTRLRASSDPAGRPEERLRDWTDRASRLYRDGLKAYDKGDVFLAHEYGTAAYDLARSIDHARNAARLDHEARDSELPPPPDREGPGDDRERTRRDLRRAYDRITEAAEETNPSPDAAFYVQAAKDLYSAARRDAEAGRHDRAGELARAAEAITHVSEHLAHAAAGPPEDRPRPERPAPKGRPAPREDDLPPPITGERARD